MDKIDILTKKLKGLYFNDISMDKTKSIVLELFNEVLDSDVGTIIEMMIVLMETAHLNGMTEATATMSRYAAEELDKEFNDA